MSTELTRSDTRAKSAETRLLSQVREQYEAQGYEASTTLPRDKHGLPAGYRPDLVLKKDSEVIVIELKRAVETRDVEALKRLRREIESHPGWHFRVLFVGDPFQTLPMTAKPGSKATRTISDVSGRILGARKLMQDGDYAGAITFIWIALEAALRAYLSKSEEPASTGITALSMLHSLFEDGVISTAEHKTLRQSYQLRSNIVHGFDTRITKPIVTNTIKTAEALIRRLGAGGRKREK
jgi:hypothetical protein